jgi:SAM-dependent methyltransferase
LITWDAAFSERYDEWSAHMTADIAFYVDLAREASGPLVELAIGHGHMAIPVAQATGKPVIGIDMSRGMLEQARLNARGSGRAARLAIRRHAQPGIGGTRRLDLLSVSFANAPAHVGRPPANL